MAENSQQSFEILLSGKLSPEMIKSVEAASKKLDELGVSAKTKSEAMRRVYKSAFDGISEEAGKAERKTNEAFAKMKEAGEKSAERVKKAWERTFDFLKDFSGLSALTGGLGAGIAAFGLAEFGKASFNEYKQREAAGAKLRQILNNQGRGGAYSDIQETIERFSTSGANVSYASALSAATMLEARGKLACAS
jgi:hypothetical protein